MNYQEILEKLKENFSLNAFAREDYRNPIEGIGVCKEIRQHGGEGQGEEWYTVKYFPEHDVYVRVDGCYYSNMGVEFYGGWDECVSEVRPKEKTITVYE